MQVVGITLQPHQKATERHVGCPENRNNLRSVTETRLNIKYGKRTNSTNVCCNYVQKYYHHTFYKNKVQGQPPVPFPPCSYLVSTLSYTRLCGTNAMGLLRFRSLVAI